MKEYGGIGPWIFLYFYYLSLFLNKLQDLKFNLKSYRIQYACVYEPESLII
jgi:hypothetical protein